MSQVSMTQRRDPATVLVADVVRHGARGLSRGLLTSRVVLSLLDGSELTYLRPLPTAEVPAVGSVAPSFSRSARRRVMAGFCGLTDSSFARDERAASASPCAVRATVMFWSVATWFGSRSSEARYSLMARPTSRGSRK